MFTEFPSTSPEEFGKVPLQAAAELTGKSPEALTSEDLGQLNSIIDIIAASAKQDPKYVNLDEEGKNAFVNKTVTDELLRLVDKHTQATIHHTSQQELIDTQAAITTSQSQSAPDPYNRSSVQ